MKNEHWTMYWKYLKEKKRRPSTKMVVAKKFFSKYFKNIREKKCEKKRATPAFRRASLRPFSSVWRLQMKGQIVDQRLTLNESQRKTALTITTPRSSTRSFANDLAPRLSTRELTLTQGDACRTHEGRY